MTSSPVSKRRAQPGVGACIAGAALALALALLAAPVARADAGGYGALEADALWGDRPREGLLILHSGYRNSPLVDADALVWMGVEEDEDVEGDVLVASVRLRAPRGYGEARVGRFVLATGAVRPIQIDGLSGIGRAPTGTTLELFGGLPVVARFGERDYDWLAGARLGQWLFAQRVGAGVSYVQLRDAGQLADEEVGADVVAVPLDWLTIRGLAAWDLIYPGLAEARVRAAAQIEGRDRIELFASRRVAARLLPATSLFSAIGAAPSSDLGVELAWGAFPRLDLGATAALESLDDLLGYSATLRATLRFADEALGHLELAATRRELGEEGYTGALLATEWPIEPRLAVHGTFEVVAADEPAGRGGLWPWLRAGASFALTAQWRLAGAIGVKATPDIERELYGLVRITYAVRGVP